jgi:BirA family transcriptional regulator, biotin operon repressor / biotin---[acetyl-CoA-carboxylase] ligase
MAEQGRDAVLTVLRQAGSGWVSGEALSHSLGVSRTAIWKQIEGLRSAGYVLEAQPRLGYRLLTAPDAVTPAEVLPGLATRRFGRQVEYRPSVGSTNDLAKQLARAGASEGLLVLADEQTAGKGRLGRSWSTPPGSALAMTLVLRPALPPYHAPRITLVAAVAVAEAVRAETGLPAGIKWPNDLQVGGRKLCGILTEMEAEMERIAFVVCGMGLNVNLAREAMPPEFRESATSLMAELGRPVARAPLVRAIMARFEEAYDQLLSGRLGQVLDRWRELSVTLGRQVAVLSVTGAPTVDGIAEDLDADGALLVRESGTGTLHRVMAGEVTLRPPRKWPPPTC